MSHNIRRLPKRLQARAQQEVKRMEGSSSGTGAAGAGRADEKPSKSRALSRHTRRRPSNILAVHAWRAAKCQWLETHIWHAKRMHMMKAWGYKLAWQPTDKR